MQIIAMQGIIHFESSLKIFSSFTDSYNLEGEAL